MTIEIELSEETKSQLDRIEELLRQVLDQGRPSYITMKEIAGELGVAYETVSRNPWMMPNYGQSEFGERPRKWRRQSWEAWKREIEDRKRDWEAASARERELMLGLRKGVA